MRPAGPRPIVWTGPCPLHCPADLSKVMNRHTLTLARWRIRLSLRSLYHHVKDTLQGKAMIAVLILASPSLWQIVGGSGVAAAAELDASGRLAVLSVAHLSLSLCFAVMIPVLLLKEFVLKRKEEPLLAHPFTLPELSLLRVVGTIVFASVFSSAFFYIFYYRLLVTTFERPVLAVAIHLVAMQLYLGILGVLLAAAARKLVLGTRVLERAQTVHRLAIVPFLLSFPLFVVLPNLLASRAPGSLSRMGESAGSVLFLLQLPLAAAVAAAGGSAWAAAAWIVVLAVAALLAFAALGSWSRNAHRELPIDLNTERLRTYESVFNSSWSRSSKALRQFSLFWTKDVLAPYLRRPSSYLQEQIVLLTGATGCFVVIKVLWRDARLNETAAGTGAVVTVLAVGAALAMLHSLDALGRERAQLALLRPVLSPVRLFTLKLVANISYVSAHGAVHAIVLSGIAALVGLPAPLPVVLAFAMLSAACLLTLAGTSLGFLFPDFHASHLFLPGASGLAKYLYGLIAAVLLACYAAGYYALLLGWMERSDFAGFITAVALVLGTGSFLTAAWGLNRLQGKEQ